MKVRWMFFIAAIGFASMIFASGQAGDDSISLGSLRLTLDASMQAVRAGLPKNYRLELNAPNSDSTVTGLVFSKPGRKEENLLGQVTFQGEKLISVMKDSGLGSREDSVPFARTLYSILHRFTGTQQRSCIVWSWQQDYVNAQGEGLTIKCGNQVAEVLIMHPDRGDPSAQITERLGR